MYLLSIMKLVNHFHCHSLIIQMVRVDGMNSKVAKIKLVSELKIHKILS